MFRNQYDTDVTTWSPQGRLFQIEYAMEAVKQGSCAVGITSKTHAVLATVNRTQGELSATLKKIFKVDDHMGIAMSGVTADGRIMCRYMRNECINYRFVYESAYPVGRLVRQVADKCQVCTQRSWQRPYGVGLLVGGYDATGPHIYQTCPSGQYWEYKAMAIGARSQAARTYLERKVDEFPESSWDGLIQHALHALQASLQDGDVTTKNVVVAVVGKDKPFAILEGDALAPFLAHLEQDQPDDGGANIEAEPAAGAPAAAADAPAPAETGDGVDDESAPMES